MQPLMVTTLLFALPLGAWLDKRTVSRGALGWAAITTVSLAIFLALARPSGGGNHPELGPAAAAAGVTFIVVLGDSYSAVEALETRCRTGCSDRAGIRRNRRAGQSHRRLLRP